MKPSIKHQSGLAGLCRARRYGLRSAGGDGTTVAADARLAVYTTRPDTLFGATYMVRRRSGRLMNLRRPKCCLMGFRCQCGNRIAIVLFCKHLVSDCVSRSRDRSQSLFKAR